MATLYGRRWDSDSHRVGQSGRAKARGARGWQRAGGPKGGRAFVRLEPDAAVEFGRSSQQRPTRAISGKGDERGEKKKMTTSEFSF